MESAGRSLAEDRRRSSAANRGRSTATSAGFGWRARGIRHRRGAARTPARVRAYGSRPKRISLVRLDNRAWGGPNGARGRRLSAPGTALARRRPGAATFRPCSRPQHVGRRSRHLGRRTARQKISVSGTALPKLRPESRGPAESELSPPAGDSERCKGTGSNGWELQPSSWHLF